MKLAIFALFAALAAAACGGSNSVTEQPTQTPVVVASATVVASPTPVAVPTLVSTVGGGGAIEKGVFFPDSTGVKGTLCDNSATLTDGYVLFAAKDICLIQYPQAQKVVLAMISAGSVADYRLLKKQTECAISTIKTDQPDLIVKIPGLGERLFWAPPVGMSEVLEKQDLQTQSCDPNFEEAGK